METITCTNTILLRFRCLSIGKTTLLKALSGQLNTSGAHLEGDITYNNDSIHSKKYLISKVADYVSETDQHIATLTVKETLEFAWMATTGGHHSYGVAKDEKSAELLNSADNDMVKVQI